MLSGPLQGRLALLNFLEQERDEEHESGTHRQEPIRIVVGKRRGLDLSVYK
jgi:hypothetical protein